MYAARQAPPPPHNIFGAEEDSILNCERLIPKMRLDDIHNSGHYSGAVRAVCLESGLASSSTPQGLCPRMGFHKGVPLQKKREIIVFGGRQATLSSAPYSYHIGTIPSQCRSDFAP